jgi:hypothetical protein
MNEDLRLGLERVRHGARAHLPTPHSGSKAAIDRGFGRARHGVGRWLRECLARALTVGLGNLTLPSYYSRGPAEPAYVIGGPAPVTLAGLAREATYRAGTATGGVAVERAHALPVLRRDSNVVAVRGVTACGRRGDGLRIGGDWRELPAHRQCLACHAAVAGRASSRRIS